MSNPWNPHTEPHARWLFDWCHLWLSIGLLRAVDYDDDEEWCR